MVGIRGNSYENIPLKWSLLNFCKKRRKGIFSWEKSAYMYIQFLHILPFRQKKKTKFTSHFSKASQLHILFLNFMFFWKTCFKMSFQWKFNCDSMCAPSLSPVQLFVAPWTLALQAPMSVGFPRKDCWTEMLFPTLGNLPDSGIETVSSAITGRLFTTESPGKSHQAHEVT